VCPQGGAWYNDGWQCGSCGHCDFCIAGGEPFCTANQATCVGHFGGYADRLRANRARFRIVLTR
jgi:D-arabinose 1-dehydrogenase-like Zn-dependent alcohol dehydrogenase